MATMQASSAAGARQPDSAVSLEQWSTQLASLGEKERASVAALAEWITSSASGPSLSSSSLSTPLSRPVNRAQGGEDSLAAPTTNGQGASTDLSVSHLDEASRPSTSSSSDSAKDADRDILPRQPLYDAPAYLAWLARQQQRMLQSAQSTHAVSLRKLKNAADETQRLLDHLEAAQVHIAELRAGAQSIEEGSEDLRDEAESMVEQIDHLSKLTEALSLRLSYFAVLPATTSFLSSPSLSLVTSEEFLLTLERLDVALAFVRAHPHYRDAALYKMRFEHCVVRAGTLIRMYVMSRFNSLATEAGVRLKEWERNRVGKGKEREFDADSDPMMSLADPPVAALLYRRFEEEANLLKRLVHELERRASPYAPQAATDLDDDLPFGFRKQVEEPNGEAGLLADYSQDDPKENTVEQAGTDTKQNGHDIFRAPEFATLLEECRTSYFDSRRSLISGIVQNCIARIELTAQSDSHAGTHENPTIRFIERGMAFLASVGRAELGLYQQFFKGLRSTDKTKQSFGSFVKGISSPLDERLQPRLVREGSMPALASVCTAFYESVDLDTTSSAVIAPYLASVSIAEAQNRLLTAARAAIHGRQIAQFSPGEEDLDYPAKLRRSHKRAPSIGGAGLLEAAADSISRASGPGSENISSATTPAAPSIRLFASPAKNITATWYPPLVSTLQLLAHTSTALPAKTFGGLALSAVEACRQSLKAGAEQMASQGGFGAGRIGTSSRMDVPLFLLRHLLILREMAASIELRLSSSAAFAVDKHADGTMPGASDGGGGVLDFGRLVDTINVLWSNLRGSAQTGGIRPSVSSPQPSSTAEQRDALSISTTLQARIEGDVTKARENLIDVVAQGVALPLRVYIDQRARARRDSGSLPPSPLKEFTAGPGPKSPSATSPPANRRKSSSASILGSVNGPGNASHAATAKVRSALQAFATCARSNLGEVSEALRLYVEDPRAIESLTEPILARILASYDAFANCVAENGISTDDVPQFTSRDECQAMLKAFLP